MKLVLGWCAALAAIAVPFTAASLAASGPTTTARQAAATLYVGPTGSDRGSCTLQAPCATLDKAYRGAAPGTFVQLASGSYPVQTIRSDDAKTGGDPVVIGPAPGASVTLAGFATGNDRTGAGAKHFELRGVKLNGYVVLNRGAEDVTIRDVDAAGLDLSSARNIRVFGGDYGPKVDGISHINACGSPGCFPSEDVVIDGALFHDYTITFPGKHSECLMMWPARRVTIRNSTFRNCTDFDLLVKPYNTGLVGSPGDIVLENNRFDDPIIGDDCFCRRGGNSIAITQGDGEAWGNVKIRYNSALGGIRVDPMITNVVVKGNVARKEQATSCSRNVSFSNNVWNGAICSSSDRQAPFATVFVGPDSNTFDLRLRRNAAAIGRADPSDAPPTDIDGAWRPKTLPADAGAYQREPARIVAGRMIGNAVLGHTREEFAETYGRAIRRTSMKLSDGAWALLSRYRVLGGRVDVLFRDDKAIELSTTSPFYRTSHDIAVGSPLRGRPPTKAGGSCIRSSRGLWIRPRRPAGTVVAELIVVRPASTPTCAVAKTLSQTPGR